MGQPFKRLHGIALPLLRDNVDTDELIPVSENTRASTSGWGDGLFASNRYLDGRGRTPNPSFILNQSPFDRASVLVSGENFGCGSSRESAVWALRDYGFKVVAAVSFNETFWRNCIVNGLAPVAISRTDAERLAAAARADPDAGVSVDLEAGRLWIGSDEADAITIHLDPFYVTLLTTGLTEDELLAKDQPAIDQRRTVLRHENPWLAAQG
jgi:3-isopropylmalate/(R)-2-methylmalate dehydratase small subunit